MCPCAPRPKASGDWYAVMHRWPHQALRVGPVRDKCCATCGSGTPSPPKGAAMDETPRRPGMLNSESRRRPMLRAPSACWQRSQWATNERGARLGTLVQVAGRHLYVYFSSMPHDRPQASKRGLTQRQLPAYAGAGGRGCVNKHRSHFDGLLLEAGKEGKCEKMLAVAPQTSTNTPALGNTNATA